MNSERANLLKQRGHFEKWEQLPTRQQEIQDGAVKKIIKYVESVRLGDFPKHHEGGLPALPYSVDKSLNRMTAEERLQGQIVNNTIYTRVLGDRRLSEHRIYPSTPIAKDIEFSQAGRKDIDTERIRVVFSKLTPEVYLVQRTDIGHDGFPVFYSAKCATRDEVAEELTPSLREPVY